MRSRCAIGRLVLENQYLEESRRDKNRDESCDNRVRRDRRENLRGRLHRRIACRSQGPGGTERYHPVWRISESQIKREFHLSRSFWSGPNRCDKEAGDDGDPNGSTII